MNVAYVRLRLSAPNCSTLALGREMDHMVRCESGEGVGEHAAVAHVDLGEAVIGPRLETYFNSLLSVQDVLRCLSLYHK